MAPVFEPFFTQFQAGELGRRFCIWHAPAPTSADPACGLVVHVHAFAEEMNKSRRMCALQARALAAAGFAVLQFDLLGCGDSDGDFDDARWDTWLDDVDTACDQALRRFSARWPGAATPPLWLWGHRAGCLLATAVAQRRQQAWQLLWWQPTASGKTVLQQFLRLETASVLMGKTAQGDTPSAKARLAAGEHAEVAGYGLSPALTQGLEAARLAPPPRAGQVLWLDLAPVAVADLSPAVQSLMQTWADAGWEVSHRQLVGPGFWQTTEIEDAPALLQATTPALRGMLAPQATRRQVAGGSHLNIQPPAAVEVPIVFNCQDELLLGIVTPPPPAQPASDLGLLIVVGGPQYRAGSHRQFVQLARAFAAAGHTAMRFDVRGMGDSGGAQRQFEALEDDIEAGVAALQQHAPAVGRVVLAGLCDGASAALMYVDRRQDPRIAGLCLLNPWARSEAGLARTHLRHYYVQRLGQRDFWRKLLRGSVGLARIIELGRSVKTSLAASEPAAGLPGSKPFQQAMADGWRAFQGPVLLGLSEGDLTAKEFLGHAQSSPPWRGLLDRQGVTRIDIAGADHTLSSKRAKWAFSDALVAWARSELAPSR